MYDFTRYVLIHGINQKRWTCAENVSGHETDISPSSGGKGTTEVRAKGGRERRARNGLLYNVEYSLALGFLSLFNIQFQCINLIFILLDIFSV